MIECKSETDPAPPFGAPFVPVWVSGTFGLELSVRRTFEPRLDDKVFKLQRMLS